MQINTQYNHILIKNEGLEREVNHLRENNKLYSDKIFELENEVRRLEHSRLENSQIRLNYESIRREVDENKMQMEVERSELGNKIKILQQDLEYYKGQDKARDQLIEKLNVENY